MLVMILEHENYRSYLKQVLSTRQNTNPSYSLRSMAKQLKMAPSLLSDVCTGKRHLSQLKALDVAKTLGMNDSERDYFCLLVQLDATEAPELKELLQRQLYRINSQKPVRDLSVDQFRAISEWYHLAILQLFAVDGIVINKQTVAKQFDLPVAECEQALERLQRLDLIEKNEDGNYRRLEHTIQVSSKTPSEALRKYHRQTMAKASEALDTQTNDERFVGSETFSFNPADFKKANAILENCFTQLIALSSQQKRKSQVYHAGIQFFRLTRKPS